MNLVSLHMPVLLEGVVRSHSRLLAVPSRTVSLYSNAYIIGCQYLLETSTLRSWGLLRWVSVSWLW